MNQLKITAVLLIMAAANTISAQADAISRYFSEYMDNEDFTVVYVSGKLFDMFDTATENLEKKEVQAIKSVVEDMKGLRLLTTDKDAGKFYEEAAKIINKKEYEVLMEIREGKSSNLQFLIKESNDTINELLLLVGESASEAGSGEFLLMSFIGKINLENLSELEKAFEDQ